MLGKLPGFSGTIDRLPLRGFPLRLGDGSRWWLAGSPHTAFMVEKLAAIMQLQEAEAPEDAHVLLFYDKDGDKPLLDFPRLQAEGWVDVQFFSEQFCFHPGRRHILAEYHDDISTSDLYLLMCLAFPAIFWETIYLGGLPFHATLLEHHGQGVILAARGNTGKSTCARRVPPPWRAPCDDEVLTVLSPEGRYLAHPFPTWSDYCWERAANTWKVEAALPLAGLFFFEQAPEDDCQPLGGSQTALCAIHSAGQNMDRMIRWFAPEEIRQLRVRMFDNACAMAKRIPAFNLKVSLTGRFWEKIETALGWR